MYKKTWLCMDMDNEWTKQYEKNWTSLLWFSYILNSPVQGCGQGRWAKESYEECQDMQHSLKASDWSLCWSRDLRREKADVWWSGHNADAGQLLMIYNVLHAPFINCIFGSQQHSSSQQHMSCILQDIVVVWYFSRLGLQCLMEIHNCFSEYWNPVPKI